MNLIIDASSINAGGGLTHLTELLKYIDRIDEEFSPVILWAKESTLNKISDNPKVVKRTHYLLNKGYLSRFLWKHFVLKSSLKVGDILYIPGTGYIKCNAKVITMFRNLLPIDRNELKRYRFSLQWIRLKILRFIHLQSFKKSDGLIVLNQYCYNVLPNKIKQQLKSYEIIPHGINRKLFSKREFPTHQTPFRLLNISSISIYRHQWNLVEAVFRINTFLGYNIHLDLVGSSTKVGLKKLNTSISKYDPHLKCTKYHGNVDYNEINTYYKNCDVFIYSSTCETFGMTVLEAMSVGVPILCSNKSSLSTLAKDAALYFDPEDVNSIVNAILEFYHNRNLMIQKANLGYQYSLDYSWEKTAINTWNYIRMIGINKKKIINKS